MTIGTAIEAICLLMWLHYLYLMKAGFVYIITNKNHTTFYIGVTSNLPSRISDHRNRRFRSSFSAMYNLNKLVYWEAFQEIGDAIGREKQLKAGSRQKKISLINAFNPEWKDLYDEVQEQFGDMGLPS